MQAVLQHRRQCPAVPDFDAPVVRAAGAEAAVPGAVAEGEAGDPVRVPDELPCGHGEEWARRNPPGASQTSRTQKSPPPTCPPRAPGDGEAPQPALHSAGDRGGL